MYKLDKVEMVMVTLGNSEDLVGTHDASKYKKELLKLQNRYQVNTVDLLLSWVTDIPIPITINKHILRHWYNIYVCYKNNGGSDTILREAMHDNGLLS